MSLNKLLLRQIQKYLGNQEEIPEAYYSLLAAISASYDHYEKDHKLLERTIDLNSNEMIELNRELREETGKLKTADHNLRMLFENIDETFFSVDMKAFKLLQMSHACEKVYGYKPEDFFTQTNLWQDVIHPDDRHISERQLQELFIGKKVQNQYRIIHKNGEIRWVENKVIPTLDATGVLERIDGITSDITERKKAEESLFKSEANLRNILENTDTAYVLLDTQYRILSYNKNAQQMALNEMEEMLEEGMNYLDLMPEKRKTDVNTKLDDLLANGKEIKYEMTYQKNNGPVKWYYISMHLIFSEEKQILGLSIAATDITERKNSEVQIKRSNERYKLVTKATKDVIWDWNFSSNKIYRSAKFRHLFGFTENPQSESWVEHIHPEDRERVQLSVMQKVNDPSATLWEDQYRRYRANGEVAYVRDRGYIVRDREKKPIRMVGALSDITLEKTLSIERGKITSDLMQRNRDLEQFSFIISHNLRLPVANIMGLVNLIQNDSQLKETERKKCLDGLYLSTSKLDGVISDLNHVLQIRNEINERKEVVSFSDLVSDIKISIQGLLQKEKAMIETNFEEIDQMVTLKSYMYSIFFNLISNSIKYRNGHSPVIKISSKKINNKIILQFKDNSMGIDLSTHANKIFGLYHKFHTHKEGKGMGLYMTKTQVEILGGTISVNSSVNHGAEFLIELHA